MLIRQEKTEDINDINALNKLAFGQPQEAEIVDKLRNSCGEDFYSLIAIENERIVGHILFSPAVIEGHHGAIKGMGLAPMAVLPEMQRKGIGTQLVKAGIEDIKKTECPFIIVLGHPEFYPRFGFEKASLYGIKSQWEGIPDEAFMILWLNKSATPPVSGIARYRDEFNEAM